VLDEIQCGFGRNGSLWAFEQFGIIPDILLLGKALGGGMPSGAFISDKKIMDSLMTDPVLGHINTFGGHPVSCAAGVAAMKALLHEKMIEEVRRKGELFLSNLEHPSIRKLSCSGLMIAVHFDNFEINKKVIDLLISKGIFTDWFLFASNALRIAPPLNITDEDILYSCTAINQSLREISEKLI
jgi:acetylornithine/succinyldiaminopimelate/putrescine aminotransferase